MSMTTFWQQYKYRIIGAGLGILFHSLILLGVLTGKGQVGILLVLFDFPLHLLGQFLSIQSETLLFGVGGTVMYALLGWILGQCWRNFLFLTPIPLAGKIYPL